MKQHVKVGQQDYSVLVVIRDTAGAPKTALAYNSAGLDVCYTRVETDNDVVLGDGAPATQTLTGAHSDWGFVEVDATKAPGLYRLDIADEVFATGAWSAVVSIIGTGLSPTHIEFVLVPTAPLDGVNVKAWNGTDIPGTDTAGYPKVTVKDGSGAGEINTTSGRVDADVTHIATAAVNTGTAQLGVNMVSVANGAITAAAIADNAIDAATFAADVDAEVAGYVWNAQIASYGTSGSYGERVESVATPTDIADAVWNEPIADHLSAGTTGGLLQDIDDEVDEIHTAVLNIAVTGASLNSLATSATALLGTETGGTTFANTSLDNGIYHVITAAGGGAGTRSIDLRYDFVLPNDDCVPTEVKLVGYLREGAPAGGDSVSLEAWNGTAWEVLDPAVLTGITTAGPDQVVLHALFSRFAFDESGSNTVRLRLYNNAGLEDGTTLNIDQIYITYAEAISGMVATIKAKTDYLPSATAGDAGGVFIAGANAATSIATALTANITGNLSGSVGSVSGNVTGSVGSVAAGGIAAASFGAGAITAAAIATGAIDADAIADNAIDAGAIATGALTSAKFAAGAIDAAAIANGAIDAATFAADVDAEIAGYVWDAGLSSYGASGSYGELVEGLDATAMADAFLARDLGSETNAGVAQERTVRAALRFLRNKWALVGTTLTVNKEDDATPAWTSTVTTDAAADPITSSDPT